MPKTNAESDRWFVNPARDELDSLFEFGERIPHGAYNTRLSDDELNRMDGVTLFRVASHGEACPTPAVPRLVRVLKDEPRFLH